MPNEITDPQRVEALREELERMRVEQYAGNLTATARALGVTSAYLSDILKGKRGVGMKVIQGMATLTGRSLDSMVGRKPVAAEGDPVLERAQAVRIVEEAVRRVRAMKPGPEAHSTEWWLLQIGLAQAQVQLGTPSRPELPATDDEETRSGARPKVVLGRAG